ncbi:MAG: thermonuclease family protein [Desulfarculales bacterium]|jgi:endonuclease YncB( thermonuclease family)|nr:thermonuclease family protein [Desulfarculales bacterium]
MRQRRSVYERVRIIFCQVGVLLLLVGLCTKVNDGDTITVRAGQQYIRVRLASIDAPEFTQDYGQEARLFLNRLCYRQKVSLLPLEKDAYGRTVARVYLPDGRDVSKEMVGKGYAWYFRNYHEDRELAGLERQARSARLGLWSQDKPQPPWQWRRQHPREERRSPPR